MAEDQMPGQPPASDLDARFRGPDQQYDELSDVDASPNAAAWLQMLRGMWGGQAEKEERYADLFGRLKLQIGERVLEVGCGAGGASRLLARLTEGRCPIVAVDPSALAIEDARRLTRGDEWSRALDFQVMDGRALDFPDEAFGAVFCTRVLVHAREPEAILREMIRVLRPGGRLMLVEPDREGFVASIPHDEVERLFWGRLRSLNPRIGSQLYGLLRRSGMLDVQVLPSPRLSTAPPGPGAIREVRAAIESRTGDYWELVRLGLVEEAALRAYAEGLEEASRTGVYFRCDLELCAFGRKPR